MFKKRMMCMMLIFVMLTSAGVANAAEPAAVLAPIGSKVQGESFTIQGTTGLPEVIVMIFRPNTTVLEMDQLTSDQLQSGKTVTLPNDAPAGTYTVKVGSGSNVAVTTFAVAAKAGGGDGNGNGNGSGGDNGSGNDNGHGGGHGDDDGNGNGGVGGGNSGGSMPGRPAMLPDGSVGLMLQAIDRTDASGTAKAAVTKDIIDQAIALIKDSKGSKLVIELPKAHRAKAYEAVLPASLVTENGRSLKLELRTELAIVTVQGNMLKSSQAGSAATVSFHVAKADPGRLQEQVRAVVGERPVIDLSVKLDGQAITWANHEAPVLVSVPYLPSAGELANPEGITVWYLDASGKPEPVSSGRYDAASGMVQFKTTHFSQYAVVHVVKTFADLAEHAWAKKPIEALAAKGIIAGISEQEFTPGAPIKRADFVLLLVRTLGLTADIGSSFSDVSPVDYYYEALGIAKGLGISEGAGDNRFLPQKEISRQEMMALTARALRIAGKLEGSASPAGLSRFHDAGDVADYAAAPIAELIGKGIIEGSDGMLHPRSSTSRAETAVMLYRIYNLGGGM